HPKSSEPLPPHLTSLERFAEYFVGRSELDFLSEEDALAVRRQEDEIIREGNPILSKSEKLKQLDGSDAWYLTTKLPWKDETGKVIGTFGISKDVTALKEAEQKLHSQLERLNLL